MTSDFTPSKPKHTSVLHSGYHHHVLREWQRCPGGRLSKYNLMYPLFISSNDDAFDDIQSMPKQKRVGVNKIVEYIRPMVENGLSSVLLFGVVEGAAEQKKDNRGCLADDVNGPVIKCIKLLSEKYPSLLIACDLCLCPYTSHGHCGVFDTEGRLDNHASIHRLSDIAAKYALAGAHIIAPSDMMDGRVKAIKEALEHSNLLSRVAVMSYSAKFASSFYGPFRDAAKSKPSFGDRKCYQLPPGAKGLACRAIQRDVEEGADIVMVKPGYPYLDIVKEASLIAPHYPIAVYQVSGEYSMLYHSAVTHNLMDFKDAVTESLEAYTRAGATVLITYFTPMVLEWLSKPQK